jgi:creatinine amidohydrolase
MTYFDMTALTSPEVAAITSDPEAVGLIPLGALEQHGPHLPLSTDSIIAQHLAVEVATRIPAPVLVAPIPPFGISEHHLGFPGTVHVRAEVFAEIVHAYISAFRDAGLRRIAIFSGHGGNFACLAEVEAAYESDTDVQVVAYTDLTRAFTIMAEAAARAGVRVSAADTHAGGMETSQILYLRGGAGLAPDTLPDGYASEDLDWLPLMQSDGVGAVSENGVLGSPRLATSPAGRAICAALADDISAWAIRELSRSPSG